MKKKDRRWILLAFSVLSLAAIGMGGREGAPAADEVRLLALNAYDFQLDIYDFRTGAAGWSRQIDKDLREYSGDVLFRGEDLIILENDRYTGLFIDLGGEKRPDSEFSLFHGLRVYKRGFQHRQFPFQDRYLPYPHLDPNLFFGIVPDGDRSAKVQLGHVYLLRLHHRTTVGDERIYILKVIEYTPGVELKALWRELENLREP